MYATCGNIQCACRVFNDTKEKDIRTWSVMIWGFAIHGYVKEALQCFERMKFAGTKPDEIAFLAVLTACSHAGRVDQGLKLFNSMKQDYYLEPNMKHFAVIVDLYGRSCQLDEALRVIQSTVPSPEVVIGEPFLQPAEHIKIQKWPNMWLRKFCSLSPSIQEVMSLCLYAGLGTWEEVERVRTSMKDRRVVKDPGWSYMEVNGQVHSFIAGHHAHMHMQEIRSKLEEKEITNRARGLGYTPETECVLHDIENEEKEDALESHNKKLALAFGLISTCPSHATKIVKNLRICGDCHSLMKHVSKLTQREIVVRDIKSVHHFLNGCCSCLPRLLVT